MRMTWLETRIPPVVWAGVASAVTWAVALVDLDGDPLDGRSGDLVGAVLAAVGISVAVAGLWEFGRAATTANPHDIDAASQLVTTGVYRLTRNPMYLGLLLAVGAWAAVLGTVVGFAVGGLLLWAALTRLQIVPEERVMADKFGEDYDAYRRGVRRWI